MRRGRDKYCSRGCAGAARRVSPEDKRATKAAYDATRRVELAEKLKRQRRDYHRRTYSPEMARKKRREKASKIAAYKREWYSRNKERKAEYDRQFRAMPYGDFAECHRLLIELEREIRTLVPDKYERAKARGYYEARRRM